RSALFITSKFDPHVDFMVDRFNRRNTPFVRFNTDDLLLGTNLEIGLQRTSGYEFLLHMRGRSYSDDDIGAIWYRRPEVPEAIPSITDPGMREQARREAEELIWGFFSSLSEHKWISDLGSLRSASYKVHQLQVASQVGLRVPETLVTSDPDRFLDFWERHRGEAIYKMLGPSVSTGTNGVSFMTYTTKLSAGFLQHLDDIRLSPCLFQEYVKKRLEIRVTVVEDQAFSCAIHSQEMPEAKIDWRKGEPDIMLHTAWHLSPEVETKCVELVRLLGLRFGAIDLILTPEGEYVFLEVNPNGQWVWIEQLTGLPISDRLIQALTE
ncbi:hypothetical protein KGQ71_03625, partial [Patescibacteria group bacterium]|nr:hypothetical protein [Patescibacteria group bacterium]